MVHDNLRTLYAAIEQGFAAPLPSFVRDELEGYIDCGVLSRGFELLAENALLRQQLIVASLGVKRPTFRPHERGMLVALSSLLKHWRSTVLLVKPETVVRWHREGFRLFWKRRSKSATRPEPRISQETIELIRMARDNRANHPATKR